MRRVFRRIRKLGQDHGKKCRQASGNFANFSEICRLLTSCQLQSSAIEKFLEKITKQCFPGNWNLPLPYIQSSDDPSQSVDLKDLARQNH